MKIRVIDKEDNTNLTLYLPLFIMKFALKRIDQFKEFDIDFNDLYKKLKKFKKEHGSFVLVEVKGSDGSYVKITI